MSARAALAAVAALPALAALVLALAGAASAGSVQAAQALTVPSLDTEGGRVIDMPATWFAAAPREGSPKAPALVLLHGCGGRLDRRGQLAERYSELAARLNALGIHALVTDSLGPRGERELCTQRAGSRRVTQLNRRRDALGALAWLAQRADVDAARVGLLGWSNGGSTVLAASNLNHDEVRRAAVRPSLAVAFYPGCEAEAKRGYRPAAPLLMLLGAADDWTPAAPCQALAAAAQAEPGVRPPQFEAYAGAYHGFDGTAPVRLRTDVPNGVNAGRGVHVGADPAARGAAAERLMRFVRDTWNLPPP